MVSQLVEPINIVDTIVPSSISEPRPGFVIDAGKTLQDGSYKSEGKSR